MGDYTAAALTIHACLRHRVPAVLDVLDEHGFIDREEPDDWKTVELGQEYTVGEGFPVGEAGAVARSLMAAAPEVAFSVYEEPAEDGLGLSYLYVPHLGVYVTACDNSGDLMLSQSFVLSLDGEDPEVRQEALGVPWLTAIAAMPHRSVTEPDSFTAHWIPASKAIAVLGGKPGGGDLHFGVTVSNAKVIADVAAVDKALNEWGFGRLRDWSPSGTASQWWCTDVYRLHSN